MGTLLLLFSVLKKVVKKDVAKQKDSLANSESREWDPKRRKIEVEKAPGETQEPGIVKEPGIVQEPEIVQESGIVTTHEQDKFDRTCLMLNPGQLMYEGYPLPVCTGSLSSKYT